MPASPEKLLFQLFSIFVAAKIVGELFERLRFPAVLGEILAGAVLGPYALSIIHPTDSIDSVAQIGAIFVLFHAGLETAPEELIRVGRKALLVALVGILVPFVLGFLYLKVLGHGTTEATFVGAAMVATSVGITARVLGDLGVLGSRAARIILGAAVFDDILGMLLLAVVAGLASGHMEWLHLGVLIGEAAVFALFMIFVGSRIIRPLRSRVEGLSTHNAPLILALAICLLLSWLASRIGMAAIIGAFFAGLIFADYSPEWELLPRVHAISDFLAPYFFFSIGSRLQLSVFRGNKVLVIAVVLSGLAIVSKLLGCGLPLLNEGWRTSLIVGIGMMPRGEVALIVALVGLNSGIVTQPTYAIVVFMTAVTTLLAPPLLRHFFAGEVREAAALP